MLPNRVYVFLNGISPSTLVFSILMFGKNIGVKDSFLAVNCYILARSRRRVW